MFKKLVFCLAVIIIAVGNERCDKQPPEDIILEANVHVAVSEPIDEDVASFTIKESGDYEISMNAEYSGDSQLNESYFIRIKYGSEFLFPLSPNAGKDLVVVDNGAEGFALRPSGVFAFKKDMALSIHVFHYSVISNEFPEFLNGEMGTAESVHADGFRVVFKSN